MKRSAAISVIAAGLLFCPAAGFLSAQDYVSPEVTVSRETVKLDGKIYYSHIVLERQTLYSISKAYGVTIEEIYQVNPSLKETGLKKNAIILIPSKGKAEMPVPANSGKQVQQEEKPSRTAEKKQDEMKKAKKGKEYFIHVVKWYEDINDIARKYDMTVESLMQYNSLKDKKLSSRQKLRIPIEPQDYDPSSAKVPVTASAPEETEEIKEEIKEEIRESTDSVYVSKNNIRIVLTLPFSTASGKSNEGAMDFYSGALIASKEMGEKGTGIEIDVFDSSLNPVPVTDSALSASDIAIGPFSCSDLMDVLAKSPSGRFVVSPLDHRADTLAARHPNFIQAPSSNIYQYEDAAAWIKEDLQSADSVILFFEKGSAPVLRNGSPEAMLKKAGVPFKTFSYNILEGRDVMESLLPLLSVEGNNRILIASESEAFVNDVIRNLNLMIHNKYKVTLYGASKIRSFETIDIDNLHNTEFHASLSYYIDYDDPQVMDFLMKYRALYNTEPTPFAFQGYDTLKYFVTLCSKYGDSWPSYISTEDAVMLQSAFKFRQEGDKGGFVNTAIRRIIYGNDYSVTLQAGISH